MARFQVKYPVLVFLLILSITLALYGGVSQVRTVASLEKMMPTDIDEIKAFNTLRDNALGEDMIAIVIQIDKESTDMSIMDIRNKEVAEYTEHLNSLIKSEMDIRETYAVTDVLLYAATTLGVTSIKDMNEQQYNTIISNPQVKAMSENFINSDFTTSIIIATTDISADDERMKLLATRVLKDIDSAGSPPGIKATVTGTPIIQQKLGELIARDRSATQNISTALVFLITMILFGTFTSALVPVIIVSLSVTWLYGIMGYANIPVSTLAGGVAAMVIGIGIDYAIHMMNKFKGERKDGKSIAEALENTVVDKGMALSGAAIATVLAFLAFLFGRMPEMNRFGMLMAIGVALAFLLSIFGLPSLLILEERAIQFIRKRMKFGVEGEYALYEKSEIHPNTHDIVDVDDKELRLLLKNHKIVSRRKRK